MPIIAMAVKITMADAPQRQDLEEGTYAICIDSDQHSVWQYDTKSPLRSTPDWRKVDEYVSESAPPMNLSSVTFDIDDEGKAWVYTQEIQPEREIKEPGEVSESSKLQRRFGTYVLEFGNGQEVASNSQSDVMANAVDVMVKAYDLLNKIEIPYMSGYKNALINNQPKHPDGRDMERPKKISGGYYLATKMSAKQKKDHIEDLADQCGAKVEFVRGWD